MSAITITLTATCSGGNHLTVAATGDVTKTVVMDKSQLAQPPSEQDQQGFLNVIGRMAKQGRTNAQAVAVMQAGVQITV